MVFSTTNLFKGIACPAGTKCMLTNCIYAHDPPAVPASMQPPMRASKHLTTSQDRAEPVTKRRKITYESLEEKPPSKADVIRGQLAAAKSIKLGAGSGKEQPAVKAPATLTKPVSPPQTNTKPANLTTSVASRPGSNLTHQPAVTTTSTTKPTVEETLNPRLVPNDPAGHQKRLVFLKFLHVEMTRLNNQVRETVTGDMAPTLVLTEQTIVKLCLDEEEKIAREQQAVYANVIKQRINGLRKMAIDDWIAHVKALHAKPEPVPAKKDKAPKPIVTGLELDREHLILPHLVADQSKLSAYGYITVPPTAEEAAKCAAAVEASGNYETCERCAARFQMYPDRNEDGSLTSNGRCHYHPDRLVTPPSTKADRESGPKEKFFPCCKEKAGYPGCTVSEDHVFKTTSAGRLAATMPFITTPDNPSPAADAKGRRPPAVTFDCEMGYTTYGLELIRLSAVAWPSGEELLDVLVRPLGAIIDLNSRFSGVFPEHFTNAIPYDQWKASPPAETDGTILPIVDHPRRARDLLCAFLTPATPLMGHGIDNDLNTVRLCHPTIVDTVVCFPHPRGLPYRFGLRMLTQRYLGRAIQTGGDRGHDSLEDARATGDLIRVKVGEKWKQLRNAGWKMEEGVLLPPTEKEGAVVEAKEGNSAGRKRKKGIMEGSDKGSADEAEAGNGARRE